MEKHIIMKVYELSLKGELGEREAAAKMLEKLMAKYGLTFDDLESSERVWRDLPHPKGAHEAHLLAQILAMVTDMNKEVRVGRMPRKRYPGRALLTAEEYADLMEIWPQYQKALRDQLDVLVSAFIQANDIFPSSAEVATRAPSKKELRAMRLARGMERTTIALRRKQLEEHSDAGPT